MAQKNQNGNVRDTLKSKDDDEIKLNLEKQNWELTVNRLNRIFCRLRQVF